MDLTTEIKGYTLEYFDDSHTYLVDGVIVPSITQMLSKRFGGRYANVDKDVLKRASSEGTRIHAEIEEYCRTGIMSGSREVNDFRFLQKQYKFEVMESERPVILFYGDKPVSAGRYDLMIRNDHGELGGADIKRVSSLDKEYVGYQLNMYRLAYLQSYDIEWKFLRAIQLKDGIRHYTNIPINETVTWQYIEDYLEGKI